jgi:hypothetical protein
MYLLPVILALLTMVIGLVHLVPELNVVPQPFSRSLVHSLNVLCRGNRPIAANLGAKPQKVLAAESALKTEGLEMILTKTRERLEKA